MGFVGILLVGPSSDTFQPVAIFGLATAVIYGMMVAMRKLGSPTARRRRTYFTMTCLVVSGGLAIFDWKTPTVETSSG